MIKVDIHKVEESGKKGDAQTRCEIELCGNAKEIISEACMFIENVREALEKSGNPAVIFAFKMATMKAIVASGDDSGDDDKEDGDKS